MPATRIRTFYQADPAGTVPGGIDTFIRGLVKWAPADLEFSLVGMTTDPQSRPPGRWTRCSIGRAGYDFFPVFVDTNAGGRSRVPLALRLTWNALRRHGLLAQDFDVLELHRIEPLLLFLNDRRPKNAFFHQDMSILRNSDSDMRWRAMPGAYFWLEDRLVPRLSSMFCVRETGAAALRQRFPALAEQTRFVPTWVDTEVFSAATDGHVLEQARRRLRGALQLEPDSLVVVTVGRIDSQKNPMLLLDAFSRLADRHPQAVLVYVGDGVLRAELERQVQAFGLGQRVRFAGLMPQQRIAELLRGSDIFALSSSYEGMPMALLEALGSGLPVVSTDVGEVRKVVSPACGEIVSEFGAQAFAAALERTILNLPALRGRPCTDAIEMYTPQKVLGPVYENYRRLGAMSRADRRV